MCPSDGVKTRTCTDENSCRTEENKPNEEKSCTYFPPESIIEEEEIQELYDRDAALQDNMPPLEAIYSQLESQIRAQKMQQFALALIIDLRETADIKLLLEGSK